MRILLTGALAAALLLPGLAPTAHAHGGQYRGPGGALPPGLRPPTDPVPPPPPPATGEPPVTQPPTTGGRPAPAPVTPGGTQPGTPQGDPFTGGSGRPKTGKSQLSIDSWMFWYEYNKDALENVKRKIYALPPSNNSPFGRTLSEVGARSGARQATTAAVQQGVIPALLWSIDPKNVQHQDIESAAYLALAKVTRDPAHLELIRKGTASRNGITAESCCLAFGLLRRERKGEQFDARTLDSARSFLFDLIADSDQRSRKRAFAAFAIGLLSDQPSGSDGYDGAKHTTARLFSLLTQEYAHPDVPASILQAIAMQSPTTLTDDHRDTLRAAAFKRRLPSGAIQDYEASYAAQALGRVGDPTVDLHALRRILLGRRTGLTVRRSAAIALGRLGARADAGTRAETAREIVQAIDSRRLRDQTSSNFAQISLAYLVRADVEAASTAVLEDDLVRKAMLTRADDGRYAARPYAALALGLVCRAIGDTPSIPLYGEFQMEAREVLRSGLVSKKLDTRGRAAFAVALGIAGDERSVKPLTERVADDGEDAELRGYCAIALGHIGIATRDVLEAVRTTLRERRSEHLRRSCATALGMLHDRNAVPILLEELEKARSMSTMGQVVVALAKVGDERSIEPLTNLLKDATQQDLTRALACAGLGIVGDANWIPALSRISEDFNYRASGDAFNEVLSIL